MKIRMKNLMTIVVVQFGLLFGLFGFVTLFGCQQTMTGKISDTVTPTTSSVKTPQESTSTSNGNFCSLTRAQKIKVVTAEGATSYTAYISVGSSQVATQ